jgi:hypothetical protein
VSGAHALLSTLVAVARGQSSLFLLTLFTFRRSTWVPWSLAVLSPRDHPRRVDQICDVSAQPLTLAVLRHCKRLKGREAAGPMQFVARHRDRPLPSTSSRSARISVHHLLG